MGLTELPPGELGAVVTYLEMTERPRPRPTPASPFQVRSWPDVAPAQYRTLFERVGGPWLWFSRLRMDDATLAASIGELHVITDRARIEVGMIELDFTEEATCLIRFLGLVSELAGRGHGEWLLAQTLALAWRTEVRRVHVHTCTLDHPAALPAYLKAGFKAYKRALETFPDPRLLGLLPREAAPKTPLIDGSLA
ncbi:MAG: GNAT family N-acetyltransferase [Sphingosinicella sp.]|nr:GNAT family N-acetyltransferase [Sphingosinicella sp.]